MDSCRLQRILSESLLRLRHNLGERAVNTETGILALRWLTFWWRGQPYAGKYKIDNMISNNFKNDVKAINRVAC